MLVMSGMKFDSNVDGSRREFSSAMAPISRALEVLTAKVSVVEENTSSLGKRLVHLENLIEHFQRRWKSEYLAELREHQRCKNESPSKRIKVGDVVLIEDKKISKSRWRLGLVTSLIEGKDGFVRGCKLRVRDRAKEFGTICLQRPTNQLCYLEINSEEGLKIESGNKNETLDAEEIDDIVESTLPETPIENSEIERFTRPPRREAAIRGEMKRKEANHV